VRTGKGTKLPTALSDSSLASAPFAARSSRPPQRPSRFVRTAALVPLLATWGPSRAEPPGPAGQTPEHVQVYQSRIRPFLSTYCVRCHNGEIERGGLRLDVYPDAGKVAADHATWDGVLKKLKAGKMPPANQKQPDPAQRTDAVRWIEAELARDPCDGRPRPGRVTLRRLNRAEYDNTVRDLFGVDLALAEDFPVDDSGYGFDNVGDVLSVSPLLMERYLAAAERVAREVIVTPGPLPPTVKRVPGVRMAGGAETEGESGEHRITVNGEIGARFDFPLEGEYTIRVSAYGEQAGLELPKMTVALDSKELATVEVKAENAGEIHTFKVRSGPGKHRISTRYINNYVDMNHKDPKLRGDRNLIIEYVELESPPDARPRPITDAHRRVMICSPGPDAASRRDCARRIVAALARRAFRRPVGAEEVERLAGLVDAVVAEGGSFEEGLRLAIEAVLVSPSFLFLIESGPSPERMEADGAYRLTDHELACRLSYFLWSSMPDEELFKLAEAGRLGQDAELDRQVARMLKDPRSRALVENFAGQWLGLRKLDEVSPDPKRFPEFDEALRKAMGEESRRFFEYVLRNDRSVMEFLLADYTFVNERLARHYGMENVKGAGFRKVQAGGRRPGGVLAQASVLTVTSDPTRTSPVKRGKWVLEQILGTPPPPPPESVPPLEEGRAAELKGTLRQRMEQHQTRPDCKSCHSAMDPIGFGLENYDAIGRWRDREGEFEIDSSGTLPGDESFNGPGELQRLLLAKRDLFRRCLVGKMLTYALGRGLEYADRCSVEAVCDKMKASGDRFSVLIAEIVKSPPFRLRATPETSP